MRREKQNRKVCKRVFFFGLNEEKQDERAHSDKDELKSSKKRERERGTSHLSFSSAASGQITTRAPSVTALECV